MGSGAPAQSRLDEYAAFQDLTYLNTASVGLVARSVQEASRAFDEELATRGTCGFDEDQEIAVLERTRQGAAVLFNADPDYVAVGTSCTELLCQIAWGLRPGRGANVISTDIDFPSVTYPWYRVAGETGCEVRLAPLMANPTPTTGITAIERIIDQRTAAVCVSHVQYLTGGRIDLRDLADLVHSHGAVLIVDATQSAGQVPIDVKASHVDALIAGSYKWLGSTFGAAVGYINPNLLDRISAPFVGWRSVENPYDLQSRYKPLPPNARSFEYSTMSYTAATTLGHAIENTNRQDPTSVLRHNTSLANQMMDGLESVGATLLTPRADDHHAGIVTARFSKHDNANIARELKNRNIIVSPRVDATRFSFHHYNTAEDVTAALEALKAILADPSGHIV